jgi:hypothetical protein
MSLIIGGAMCALGGLLLVSGVNRGVTALTLYRNAATPVRKVAQTDGPVEFDGIAEPSADTGIRCPVFGQRRPVLPGMDGDERRVQDRRRRRRTTRARKTGETRQHAVVMVAR